MHTILFLLMLFFSPPEKVQEELRYDYSYNTILDRKYDPKSRLYIDKTVVCTFYHYEQTYESGLIVMKDGTIYWMDFSEV